MSDYLLEFPERGFPESEFQHRTQKLQRTMAEQDLGVVLLTTEANVRYFTGFLSQFWQSPTRPWFLVVPAAGKPVAVIPEIGLSGMQQTWVDDVRSWPSPRPEDDGISLLTDTIRELSLGQSRVGMPMGLESMARMPVNDLFLLRDNLAGYQWVDVAQCIHRQRVIKSELEIEKVGAICQIVSASFKALPGFADQGMREIDVVARLKIEILESGADSVSYMVAGSGQGGYDSIIMGPTERYLGDGDVLIIDTGSIWDGYFCDFDRNWCFGSASRDTRGAYETVWAATQAGFETARPGATTTDIWRAMNRVLEAGGSMGNEVGRLGHGLGMELTEWPSITASDNTVLEAGMVITLEPGMTFASGRQMVHEENIAITDQGARWLTDRADPQLPEIN